MPIGREKRFGRLAGSNIKRFATNNDLSIERCRELMVSLAERVYDAVQSVVEDNRHITGVERIGPAPIRTISANCKAMLSNMDAHGKTLDTSQFALIGSGDMKRYKHGV